jgi:hypothetical protein
MGAIAAAEGMGELGAGEPFGIPLVGKLVPLEEE